MPKEVTLEMVYDEVKQINGKVTRHDEELFGGPHGTIGAIRRLHALEKLAIQVRTAIIIFGFLLSLVGVSNVVLIVQGGG